MELHCFLTLAFVVDVLKTQHLPLDLTVDTLDLLDRGVELPGYVTPPPRAEISSPHTECDPSPVKSPIRPVTSNDEPTSPVRSFGSVDVSPSSPVYRPTISISTFTAIHIPSPPNSPSPPIVRPKARRRLLWMQPKLSRRITMGRYHPYKGLALCNEMNCPPTGPHNHL